jgi:AraC-like DNA-binding protein
MRKGSWPAAFTVSGAYLRAIEEWLNRGGYGTSRTSQRIRAIKRDESVGLRTAERLLAEAAHISGRPLAALEIGRCVGWQHLGAIGHMLASARTLEEMLNGYVFYESLFYRSNIANVRRSADGMELYWNAVAIPPHYSRYAMSSFAAAVSNAGLPADSILSVAFPFDDSTPVDVYRDFFAGAEIRFNADLGIAFRRPALQLETRVPASAETKLRFIAEHFSPIGDLELALRVYEEVVAALPRRQANLRTLSAKLAMSPRTLQRRLAAMPDGLRGTVLAVRMHLACEYLLDESMSLSAASLVLGYSEQSAFQLAFKRYHGKSPHQWRSQASPSRGPQQLLSS